MRDERLSIVIYGATGYCGGAILPVLAQDFPNAHITALARSRAHDGPIRAAGAHSVVHFDASDVETLRAAVAAARPDVVVYAGYDVPAHVDALIAGAAAQGRTRTGRLPIFLIVSGTTCVLDRAPGVFEEGKTKVWDDMNEDDMRTLPPDAPHHRATDDPVLQADAEGRINAHIIAPAFIYGESGGPVRRHSLYFEMMLGMYVALGARVAHVGPGTNIAGEIHILDVAAFASFLLKHELEGREEAGRTYRKIYFLARDAPYTRRAFSAAAARVLHARGVVASPDVHELTHAEGLAAPAGYVVAGNQAVRAGRARAIGWEGPRQSKTLIGDLAEWFGYALQDTRG